MARIAKQYGWNPDPEGTARIVAKLRHPVFGVAAHAAMAKADGETVLLYPSLLKVMPDWKRGAQGIGSCVGWGWSLSVDILSAVEIMVKRESQSWQGRTLEAATYAFSRVEVPGKKRAGRSDGSYGAAAAKAVSRFGTLQRKQYDRVDARRYSAQREKEWGDTGVPDHLEPIARKNRVRTVSLVTSFDEAAAAIASGYPVPVCSNQGFTMKRDSDGFCRAKGSWGHCMCFASVRHGRRPGLLCTNSWGDSNTGPRWPKDMPDAIAKCSFWVDADVANRMLGQYRDSFALSAYDGFPPRKLPDIGSHVFG